MPVRVKQEEVEGDEEVPSPADGVQVVDNNNDNNDAMQIDDDDDDEDEIVREMDVYLSPQVVHQLYMLQFPLQHLPAGTGAVLPSNSQAPPVAARIKPTHNMLELDHTIPTHCIEQQGINPLSKRTYASHCVPVTTHLALGKVVASPASSTSNNNNNQQHELHLAPLHHITQMRPTFGHIDAEDPDNSENIKALEEEQAKVDAKQQQQQQQQDKERKPLMFQKKESERAANARKNSYAFKKASEEGEPWIDLKVIDLENDDDDEEEEFRMSDQDEELPSKEEMTKLRKLLELPLEFRKQCVVDNAKGENDDEDDDVTITAAGAGGQDSNATSSLASYVRSLDYLPAKTSITTAAATAESETTPAHLLFLDWKQSGFKLADMDLPTIGAHMTSLLREGWPIPFSILQKTMPPGVPEKDILTALSSCAVLVRGNFVLQSRLMTELPKPVAKARTFMLLLLQCMGVIHRSRLDYVFGITNSATEENDDGSDKDDDHFYHESLSAETLLMLLELVAKKTPRGWVLRGQDDVDFLHRFPENANLHMEYWGRQMLRFQHHLQRYASAST